MSLSNTTRWIAVLLCAIAISGCSTLPNSGPTDTEIENGEKNDNQIGFKIINVTPAVVAALSTRDANGPPLSGDAPPGSVTRVGVGDVLAVAIFTAGGSFASPSGDAATSGGNEGSGDSVGQSSNIQSQSLPLLQVDEQGSITIPFAGRLHVAGKTPNEIGALIDRSLSGTVYHPQALVGVTRNISNTVLIHGDVKKPGRFPILIPGERLIDMLTEAGGSAFQVADISIALVRDGRRTTTSLEQISADSATDIAVRPGDDIEVTYKPRTFLSFGASGKVSQIKFDADTLSLAEGIARIGGPADDRADPSAVYLFRFEQPQVMTAMNMPAVQTPVIYKVNLLDPQSYFELQRIKMSDRDLIYVANARSNRFFRFLTLVNSVFIPVATTYNLSHG